LKDEREAPAKDEMDLPPPDIQSTLTHLRELLETPFWRHPDFWISSAIGIVGACIAYGAYRQAENAKDEAQKATKAATEAGKTVKLQTVCIDLTEIAQKLAVIEKEITFEDATYLLTDTSRHLLRVMSPFADHGDFRDAIAAVETALQTAQSSLKEVLPTGTPAEGAGLHTVYYNMVDKFAAINNCVARLTGLMEKHTYDFGRDDAKR
jgi:hypothetical protein